MNSFTYLEKYVKEVPSLFTIVFVEESMKNLKNPTISLSKL